METDDDVRQAELIREIAFQAAGVGSGAVMRRAPGVVMPEREIIAGVNQVLSEHGVTPPD